MRTEPLWRLDEDAPGPRKPLYLRGGPGLRVEADGPALRLRRPAKAAVWYPLARLARVVSSGMVDWDAEALLACAEAGVPVVFLRRDGSVRAYLSGGGARSRDSHDLLYTRLRGRLSQPGGMARYGGWRNAMTRAAVQALSAQLGSRLEGEAPHRLRQALTETRQRYAGVGPCALIDGRLHGLRAGLSAELLAETGLDAARWAKLEDGPDLAGDLAELLGWALEAPLLAVLERRFRGEPAPDLLDEAQLIGWFESRAADSRRLGLDALHRLRQWLETV
ncbi:MAG: CRISPR-associated endonuclease Cas1 [Candidatus Competibacter sp.]|nr:CRISPR-associated endonuclease Cas1 [Candidatus Competibacter sp.]MDG4584815.1 CRISPR-associated endonuclease Cas1 [Candidatus Competibacter sp.]